MKPNLEQTLVQAIDSSGLIAPGDRVGVAVSGGADSVALLNLLDAARSHLGIALMVVHFDHCLRGESAEDARFVENLARSRRLTFIGERTHVAEIAALEKRNLEDAARRLRYEFFARVVQQGHATKIAVAHTMDDQAETVVARLLRGTGPSGLAGIYPSVETVIRPLLGIRRAVLRDYLRMIKQEWCEEGQIWTPRGSGLEFARGCCLCSSGIFPLMPWSIWLTWRSCHAKRRTFGLLWLTTDSPRSQHARDQRCLFQWRDCFRLSCLARKRHCPAARF